MQLSALIRQLVQKVRVAMEKALVMSLAVMEKTPIEPAVCILTMLLRSENPGKLRILPDSATDI